MSAASPQPYAAFRLNLEQQKKRAKDLLKAARSGEPAALRRLGVIGTPDRLQLALAQHCIARELRFANWAALKWPYRGNAADARHARWCCWRWRLPHHAYSLRR